MSSAVWKFTLCVVVALGGCTVAPAQPGATLTVNIPTVASPTMSAPPTGNATGESPPATRNPLGPDWFEMYPSEEPPPTPSPPPPPDLSHGPDEASLTLAEQHIRVFVEQFNSYGAGDETSAAPYLAVRDHVSNNVWSRFEADMAATRSGQKSEKFWRELVEQNMRHIARIEDYAWAELSSPDWCVAAVLIRSADVGEDRQWPPFTKPQWLYVTATRESGWKVDSWTLTPPPGYIPPG